MQEPMCLMISMFQTYQVTFFLSTYIYFGWKSNLELEKYYFFTKGTQSANGIDSYTYPSFDSPTILVHTPTKTDKR